MFLADDVVELVRNVGVALVQQAVLAPPAGAAGHELFQRLGDVIWQDLKDGGRGPSPKS